MRNSSKVKILTSLFLYFVFHAWQNKTDNFHCNFSDEAEITGNVYTLLSRNYTNIHDLFNGDWWTQIIDFIDSVRAFLSWMVTLLCKCLLLPLPLLPSSDCQSSPYVYGHFQHFLCLNFQFVVPCLLGNWITKFVKKKHYVLKNSLKSWP